MNFAFWIPALFSLGIIALAGSLLFLAALDSYGPAILKWVISMGYALRGFNFPPKSSALKH